MAVDIANTCCGFNLKYGVIAIGVVQSVLAFSFMILTAAYAEHPQELLDMTDPSIVPNMYTLKSILIIISVASALQCVYSILLIIGAEMNRPSFLLPWLIFNPLAIVIYVIGTVIGLVHHKGVHNTGFVTGHLVVGIAICVIGAFKISQVYNYFKHLRSLNF